MKVKIFSLEMSSADMSGARNVLQLEKPINEFLKIYPSASIQWLQSSEATHTTLTAIITYCDDIGTE